MAETSLERSDSIANRDEPIPVLRISTLDDDLEPSSSEAEAAQKSSTKDKLKDQAQKILDEKLAQYGTPEARQSLGDRLFAGIISQIVVPDDNEDEDEGKNSGAQKKQKLKEKLDRRSRKYVDRPNFSTGLMLKNFNRFNARIGVVFVLQNRLIHLFTWRHPTATLSFLATYSFLCLNPALLPLVPLLATPFWIMIPSFLARHPAPANDPRIEPSYRGPAVAPPSRVKPATQGSKDFWRNARDLQNCMEDFSRLHDVANEYVTPYTNFSDEGLSSTLFVVLSVLSCAAVIGSHVVPWRFVALLAGWMATLSLHPDAQTILLSSQSLSQVRSTMATAHEQLRSWIDSDILLDEPPEIRQVEIFELQKYHPYSDTWEPWLFSTVPYDPLSPARIAGARAKGTQFFADVQAPGGWTWHDKKWTLDLVSREWVEQRMITGVEIETEGERWVFDLPEEVVEQLEGTVKKGKKGGKVKPRSGWEEGSLGLGERGEWRRRRWVRRVERKVVVGGGKGGAKPG